MSRNYGNVIGSFIMTTHLLMQVSSRIITGWYVMILVHHILCRVFWWNIKSPRWLSPHTAQIWHPVTPGFFPTKIIFEREEISDHQWDSGKYDRATDSELGDCVRSQGAYFEGDWDIIVLWTMFLVSCIFFSKGLCFSYYMAGYLLDRPRIFKGFISIGNTDVPCWKGLFCGA